MNKYIIYFIILFITQQVLAQTSFPCYQLINNPVITYSQNTGNKIYEANCLVLSTSPIPSYGPIIIEDNAQTTFRANKSIHIKEGFQGKSFSSTGYAHFTVGNGRDAIEPFIMNLPSPVVGKHKKIEIGFKMPEEIENQVSNYLSNPANYIGLNPYDPAKINIVAEFRNSVNSNVITKYGFYYEYFEKEAGSITTNGTITSGGLIKKIPNNDDMLKWRVRFAPTEVGFWYGTIKIYINGSFYTDIVGINFECVPSNEHGYLEVGVHNRQFRFSDDSTSFYAIGQNLTWPTTLKYLYFSNVLTNSSGQSYQVENGTEEWLHTFKNLGDNGGNFARTVFYQGDNMDSPDGYDGGQEIEWEKLGDYQSRQHCMFVLDEVFDIAEQKGIFIMLTPNIQNEFEDKWQWNPYRTLSAKNSNNPLKPTNVGWPEDFLTNATAKDYYKRKLRYIHARWGYGPHLGAYELVSEINNWTGYYSGNLDETFNQKMFDWQWEMFLYQKGILGVKQLISTCYYGTATHDESTEHSAFSFVDFTSMHGYANKKHQSIERQKAFNDMLDAWNKPTNFGEMGMSNPTETTVNGASVAEADPNDYEKCDGTEWHNALWATAFMEGYGAGLNWWANDIDAYRAANFPAMKQFFSNVVFEADQWTFNQHWSNDPFEFSSLKYPATLEVFAMTTNSSHKAMGWVHQATNWWGNKKVITGCRDRNNLQMPITSGNDGDGNDDEAYPHLVSENFQITGLIPFTQYQFDFFRTDDGAGAWYSSQIENTNILGIANPGIPDTYYDFAFKASKSGVTFRDNNSSNTTYSPKPDTLACNTKSIKINYVWFNDTLGVNKYEWSWGDKKSSEQFPEITFDKAGNYKVRLKIIKKDNTVENFEQLIVLPTCKIKQSFIKADINFNDVKVFPNPTHSNIFIQLLKTDDYQLSVLDMIGNNVIEKQFHTNETMIDFSELHNGTYIIKILSLTNAFTIKIIKL
jgi:hypothetical protein